MSVRDGGNEPSGLPQEPCDEAEPRLLFIGDGRDGYGIGLPGERKGKGGGKGLDGLWQERLSGD